MGIEWIAKRLEDAEPLTVKEVMAMAHETARDKGWWEDWNRNVPEQLALMHSEISEALEEYRNGKPLTEVYYPDATIKPEGFGIEISDLLIRVADTCGRYDIDLDKCLREKLRYNLSRERRHGNKVC